MSDKFLGTGYSNVSLTNGSQPIYAASLSALNLQTSMAIKTDTIGQLMSSNLDINDINNLQSTLDSIGSGIDKVVNITNAIEDASTTFKGDILPSAHNTYDLGEGGTSFRDIYASRILSQNGLTNLAISNTDIVSNTSIEATSFKKTSGTSSQYLMADGSSLQYSANSGNANFYLYKSKNGATTPPPAAGFVYYNNSSQKLATMIYVSNKTDDNTDVEVFFLNISQLNDVYIQTKNLSENFIRYNITGAPTITVGSHIAIPVVYSSFGGNGETSFGVDEPILLSFFTNSIETDLRITTLETKTQNQTAITGTTTFTGAVEAGSLSNLSQLTITSPYVFLQGEVIANNIIVPHVPGGASIGDAILPWGGVYTNALSISGNILPNTANDRDIGSVSVPFKDIYANKITGLITPVANTDGANKLYVDGKAGNQTATVGLTTFSSAIKTSVIPISDLLTTYGTTSLRLGLRKLSSTYTGACVNVTASSTIDIGFDAYGILDYTTFATLTGAVYVNTWYDQSGNGYNFIGATGTGGVQPLLTFSLIGGKQVPTITFNNSKFTSIPIATCTALGLDNPNHATITTMKSTTVNTNVMFLHGSNTSISNEFHTNTGSFGARVIDDATSFADFGVNGSFTNSNWHVLVAGALNDGTQKSAGRGDLLSTTSATATQTITPSSIYILGIRNNNLLPFYGDITEVIIFSNSWITDSTAFTDYYNNTLTYKNTGSASNSGLIMNSNRITELATPIISTDATNKTYVDDQKGVMIFYTASTLPTAVGKMGQMVYVSDEKKMAFSDNTIWVRMTSGWTQPAMTSATTPSPYKATTNSQNAAYPTFWKVFDSFLNGGNFWHSADGSFNVSGVYTGGAGKTGIADNGAWAVLEMDVARSISQYTLHNYSGGSTYFPQSWHIMYSTDGINYVSVDQKVNQSLSASTAYNYSFTPVTAKFWGIQIYKTGTSICITQELVFAT